MTKSQLTVQRLQEVLNYDPETGIFTWAKKTCRKVVPGTQAGYIRPDGYRIIRIDRAGYRASRLAWLYMTGNWPSNDIDHVDGNTKNNSFKNLRDVTTAGNIQNQRKHHNRNRTGGYLGVSRFKNGKRYRARICTNGVQVLLGWFDTAEEAHQAYVDAKRKHHSTCTI